VQTLYHIIFVVHKNNVSLFHWPFVYLIGRQDVIKTHLRVKEMTIIIKGFTLSDNNLEKILKFYMEENLTAVF